MVSVASESNCQLLLKRSDENRVEEGGGGATKKRGA